MGKANETLYNILIVDDEQDVLNSFELTLYSGGLNNILLCNDSRKVLSLIEETSSINVILLDLIMPHMEGQELLRLLAESHPEIPVIVVTALYDLEKAVNCIKAGAFDYLVKPVEKVRLISSVRRAIEKRELSRENTELKKKVLSGTLENPHVFKKIATRSENMFSIFKYIEAIATSTEPVLITGETGVGKELVAHALHDLSGLTGKFIGINIAGLDDQNFSDTLFGHRKGAFTGADTQRQGLIKAAEGGTLFLDEIGDLSQASQVKLLRLLQEQEYFPLGSDISLKSNVRILTATHKDLHIETHEKALRRDLYYRLKTHEVHIPPLRDRIDDIPILIDVLLEKISLKLKIKKPHYPDKLHSLLKLYNFPGNVRELESILYDAVIKQKDGFLQLCHFNKEQFTHKNEYPSLECDVELFANVTPLPTLVQSNNQLINEAIRRSNGNQSIASQHLGITQSALSRRLKRMKLKN